MKQKIRIGALISGGGTNLQAIIDACEAGRIAGDMVFVGADKDDIKGLERARRHGIDTFIVNYSAIIKQYRQDPDQITLPADFDPEEIGAKQKLVGPNADPRKATAFLCTRAIAEAQLLTAMAPFQADLLLLAGFMRNLTPYFIDHFNTEPDHPRIMNIHPALLPAFAGIDGYGDTYRYGCKVGGCTVHFIDYGEDSGPIIGQKCFPITDEDSLESIQKKGLALEWQLYPECVALFAAGRLQTVTMTHRLHNGQVWQRKVVKIAAVPKS